MGLIKDVVTDVATNVIEDAADNLVIGAVAGTVTAVAAGAAGIAKGAKAVGKAAVATKNAVVDAKNSVEGFVDGATENTRSVVNKALEATVGDEDTRHYRKELRYLSKFSDRPAFIVQKVDTEGDIFRIFNTEEALLYRVRGVLSDDNLNLSVFRSDNVQIAAVYKSIKTKRAPIFHERRPVNYIVEIMGQQAAVMKTKLSKTRAKEYEIEPQGWNIQIKKSELSISNDQGVIVHGSKRIGYDAPTYILDFQQQEDMLISMLLIMCLILREYE